MEWYLKVIKNYVGFGGRARRKEYWMYFLIYVIIAILLSIIDQVLHLGKSLERLYSLALVLPSIAVGARRLHDIGKSGWWQLIAFIPIVGIIILIIFWCQDSQDYTNKYGPNPKSY